MLFRKKMEKRCGYCVHSGRIDEDRMICPKKGVVSVVDHCHRFRYDPLKRTPTRPKPVDFRKYDKEDFSL